jgi:hypothetical protein
MVIPSFTIKLHIWRANSNRLRFSFFLFFFFKIYVLSFYFLLLLFLINYSILLNPIKLIIYVSIFFYVFFFEYLDHVNISSSFLCWGKVASARGIRDNIHYFPCKLCFVLIFTIFHDHWRKPDSIMNLYWWIQSYSHCRQK